jgi:hypothetical protein
VIEREVVIRILKNIRRPIKGWDKGNVSCSKVNCKYQDNVSVKKIKELKKKGK